MEHFPDATFEDVTYSTKKVCCSASFLCSQAIWQVAELSTMIAHLWNLLWILKTYYWRPLLVAYKSYI